jgi:hypothetical protein
MPLSSSGTPFFNEIEGNDKFELPDNQHKHPATGLVAASFRK